MLFDFGVDEVLDQGLQILRQQIVKPGLDLLQDALDDGIHRELCDLAVGRFFSVLQNVRRRIQKRNVCELLA